MWKLLLNLIFHSGQAGQGWGHRHRLHRRRHAAGPESASRGRFHDQRNVDSRVIDKEAMLFFAMLAQRLSMIAEHDDGSAVIKPVLLQPGDQAPQFVIGVGDFAVIGMRAVLRAKRLRRIVRTVRIIQMQPEEERPSSRFLQP